MPQTILVTGADGFIGSHLVEHLTRLGHKVRAMALYNAYGTRGWLEHIDRHVLEFMQVISGDVRDDCSTRAAMRGCDAVVHLAALIGIPYSYSAPESYVDTNIKGTLNILQAARELGVGRVVHTSTSEVYGSAQRVPIDEHHPMNAQSPYAATKIAADQLALSFHAAFGLPVVVVRPFNTYGPRQSTRAVIPTVITQIASGARKIKLGATAPTRDFNYVTDIVRGFACALATDNASGLTINLGSGFEIAIGDLARMIAREMGETVEILTDEQRMRPEASEVNRLLADNALAKTMLGWQPEFTGADGLLRGLSQTIAWYRQPSNLALYRSGVYAV